MTQTKEQFNAQADIILDKAIVDENIRAEESLSFDFDKAQTEYEGKLKQVKIRIAGEVISIYEEPPAEVLRLIANMYRAQRKNDADAMFKFFVAVFGDRIVAKLLHKQRVTMAFLGNFVVPKILDFWGMNESGESTGELAKTESGS